MSQINGAMSTMSSPAERVRTFLRKKKGLSDVAAKQGQPRNLAKVVSKKLENGFSLSGMNSA